MAGGVPVGTLSIEIVAEIAKLQQDMERTKRLVGDMSNSVGRSARAANDNLRGIGRGAGAGIQDFSREVARLKASIDPAFAAMQKYKGEVRLLQQALREGAITHKQYVDQMRMSVGAFQSAGRGVVQSTGAQRQGMQQLSFQLGDVATMYALGARPAQIFASQIGQVTQAVGLMSNSSKGLIGFLGGPWGMGIAAAAVVLTPFISKLFESKSAADQAAAAISNLANAMAALNNTGARPSMQDLGNVNIERLKAEAKERALMSEISRLENAGPLTDVQGRGKIATTLVMKERREQLRAIQGELVNYRTAIKATEMRLEKYAALEKLAATSTASHGNAVGTQSTSITRAQKEQDQFLKGLNDARIEIDNFFRENDPVKKLTEEWEKNSPAAIIINEIDRIREMEVGWKEKLGSDELQKAREAAERYADSINSLINALGGLGKVGGALGGLIGLFSGQTGAIGGPIGALLNMQVGTGEDEKTGKTFAITMGDELRDIFKLGGTFGKTMESLLGGTGTGMIAGQAFFGQQSKTEQLGSALGGALGKVAGDAIGKGIGGALGQAMGPLGSILGGVLGGVLGGMLSKTPWGRVNLSAQGASNPEGNSGASRRAAVKAGGSFDTALQEIADAFGGGIGDFGNITLGVRHGDWRVNETGTSLKKKKGATDFDGDAEGAIAFAIQIAIERGAITGIRESTQRLLKSSDDLKANLDRALSFEGVFKELASIKDPVGFALDELTREFDRLRDIFEEAGASAAEYANLEELLAHKRQEVADKAAKDAIDKLGDRNSLEVELLRLLGKEEDALAAARLNELANLEASLQPLQALVFELQDARAVMDQFGPLADDLKAFRAEILGGGATNNSMAFIERQFRETAAMARDGDAAALGNLRGTATEFLDAAKANASSALDYQRAVGEVLASVDDGIFAADSQIEYAQLQIDAINNSANILQSMRDEMAVYQQRLVEQGEWTQRQFRRWDSEGLRIQNDSATPVYTTEVV